MKLSTVLIAALALMLGCAPPHDDDDAGATASPRNVASITGSGLEEIVPPGGTFGGPVFIAKAEDATLLRIQVDGRWGRTCSGSAYEFDILVDGVARQRTVACLNPLGFTLVAEVSLGSGLRAVEASYVSGDNGNGTTLLILDSLVVEELPRR